MKKFVIQTVISLILIMQLLPVANAAYGLKVAPKDALFKEELQTLDEKDEQMELTIDKVVSVQVIYIIQKVSDGILYVAAPLAILFIAYSGFAYINAMGNQEGLEGAKKTLTWAILGLLLIIISYGIVRLIIAIALKAGAAATS